MSTEEYFTIREGIATYLCRKKLGGCEILAQLGKSGRWIKYQKPQFWRWWRELDDYQGERPQDSYYSRQPETQEPISREEVTAILLMGKNEREL